MTQKTPKEVPGRRERFADGIGVVAAGLGPPRAGGRRFLLVLGEGSPGAGSRETPGNRCLVFLCSAGLVVTLMVTLVVTSRTN